MGQKAARRATTTYLLVNQRQISHPMQLLEKCHRLLNFAATRLPLRPLFERAYEREFSKNTKANLFRGVFLSFDKAKDSSPRTRPVGYDHADAAAMYLNRTRKIFPADYPMLFWLNRLFADGHTHVADLGGHIGVSYYAYAKYLDFPQGLRWQVHDVPAVMQQGRRLDLERQSEKSLSFADRFEDCDGSEVLIASGSLQYLPESLPALLARLANPPTHLLLNLLPLHSSQSFFTLQSIGTAFCPYHIASIGEFVKGIEAAGYMRIDQWENAEKSCVIPFYPDHSLDSYYGFYFSRRPVSVTRATRREEVG